MNEWLNTWLELGGYGRYVWPAYGGSVLLLGLELWQLRRARLALLQPALTDEESA